MPYHEHNCTRNYEDSSNGMEVEGFYRIYADKIFYKKYIRESWLPVQCTSSAYQFERRYKFARVLWYHWFLIRFSMKSNNGRMVRESFFSHIREKINFTFLFKKQMKNLYTWINHNTSQGENKIMMNRNEKTKIIEKETYFSQTLQTSHMKEV